MPSSPINVNIISPTCSPYSLYIHADNSSPSPKHSLSDSPANVSLSLIGEAISNTDFTDLENMQNLVLPVEDRWEYSPNTSPQISKARSPGDCVVSPLMSNLPTIPQNFHQETERDKLLLQIAEQKMIIDDLQSRLEGCRSPSLIHDEDDDLMQQHIYRESLLQEEFEAQMKTAESNWNNEREELLLRDQRMRQAYDNELRILTQELESAKATIGKLEDELSETRGMNCILERNDNIEHEINNLRNMINDKDNELKQFREHEFDLKREWNRIRKQYETTINNLKEECTSQMEESKFENMELMELLDKVRNQASETISMQSQELTTLRKKLKDSESELQKSNDHIINLQMEISQHKKKLTDTNNNYTKQIQDLKTLLSNSTDNCNNMQAKLTAMETKLKHSEEQRLSIRGKLHTAEMQYENEIAELQRKLQCRRDISPSSTHRMSASPTKKIPQAKSNSCNERNDHSLCGIIVEESHKRNENVMQWLAEFHTIRSRMANSTKQSTPLSTTSVGWLGMELTECSKLHISAITMDGPAALAGLNVGDVIQELELHTKLEPTDMESFSKWTSRLRPGDRILMRLLRNQRPIIRELNVGCNTECNKITNMVDAKKSSPCIAQLRPLPSRQPSPSPPPPLISNARIPNPTNQPSNRAPSPSSMRTKTPPIPNIKGNLNITI